MSHYIKDMTDVILFFLDAYYVLTQIYIYFIGRIESIK